MEKGLPGTLETGSCRKGAGEWGRWLRPGKSLCNFSGKAGEAAGGRRAELGAVKRGPGVGCWGGRWAPEQGSALPWTRDTDNAGVWTFPVCSEVL